MSKFLYQIRCRNGAVVDNLQIIGELEMQAREKLMQMYPHCEILQWSEVTNELTRNISYEDVLDLINK